MELQQLIDKARAKYPNCLPGEREVLETVFGADILGLKITDRVKDFNDICTIAGVDPKDYTVTGDMTTQQKRHIYVDKIHLIAQVLNEGVKLEWHNKEHKKWFPWFEIKGAGFGFSDSDYGIGNTDSTVGSRFASEKLADFAGKTFTKEFEDYLNAQ